MDENVPPSGHNPFAVRVVAPTDLGSGGCASGSSGSGGINRGGGGIGASSHVGESTASPMAPASSFADLPAHRSKPFLDALARCSAPAPPPLLAQHQLLQQQLQQQSQPWAHSPSHQSPSHRTWPLGFNGGSEAPEGNDGAANAQHGPVCSGQSGGMPVGGAPVYTAPP